MFFMLIDAECYTANELYIYELNMSAHKSFNLGYYE